MTTTRQEYLERTILEARDLLAPTLKEAQAEHPEYLRGQVELIMFTFGDVINPDGDDMDFIRAKVERLIFPSPLPPLTFPPGADNIIISSQVSDAWLSVDDQTDDLDDPELVALTVGWKQETVDIIVSRRELLAALGWS